MVQDISETVLILEIKVYGVKCVLEPQDVVKVGMVILLLNVGALGIMRYVIQVSQLQ
jgi:hypothetical protein